MDIANEPSSYATSAALRDPLRRGAAAGQNPTDAAIEFIRDYARERPEVVALWTFGLGFVLAWKLKPW